MNSPTPKSAPKALPPRPQPNQYRYDNNFVGGIWQPATGADSLPVFDCATEEQIGAVRSASIEDVDSAVAAADSAFAAWSRTEPQERVRSLTALHAELSKRTDELAGAISAEVGTAARLSPIIQVSSSLQQLELTTELLSQGLPSEKIHNTTVIHEPVGVVAAITPWNYPLFQTMSKVAGALAAGCTIVHKPSELAPISTYILAEAVEAAGLPTGVYNVVSGTGPTIGEAMVGHARVDMVSFTGSTLAGTRVYQLAAGGLKRVALELGGKSASLVLDDADLSVAIKGSVNRAFLNSGQTCDAWTRLLVPSDKLDDVVDLIRSSTERLVVGDPFDERTRLGPLISQRQLDRVRGLVEGALSDGAVAVVGGPEKPEGFDRGHYFQATVLTGVTSDMPIAQQEVFGPVLSVLTYDSEDEAIAIANDSAYGLSGAVWSSDSERADRVARRIRSGQVVINGGSFNPWAPFGGMKNSGLGREMGSYGISEFFETKALQY